MSVNKYNLILGGDYNVNTLENSVQTLLLTNSLNSAGFRNVITSPTRVTLSTSNSIDLFITNANTDVKVAGTVSCDISDHNPIFLSFYNHDFKKQVNKNKNTITFQNISNSNILAFRNAVISQDWDFLYSLLDVNNAYNQFIQTFKMLYDLHFPKVTVTASKKIRKLWVTPVHIKMMQKKDRLYKAFLRSRDLNKLVIFKKFRNELTAELRKAKSVYYKEMFNDVDKQRPDIMWKKVNEALNRGTISKQIGDLIVDGQTVSGVSLAKLLTTIL